MIFPPPCAPKTKPCVLDRELHKSTVQHLGNEHPVRQEVLVPTKLFPEQKHEITGRNYLKLQARKKNSTKHLGYIRSVLTDQQGIVVNPDCGQLNSWSRETGSAVPSASACSFSTLRSNLVLTHEILPAFRNQRRRSHICMYAVKCHRVSPEFIGSRNCVPMAFTAESPRAHSRWSNERVLPFQV